MRLEQDVKLKNDLFNDSQSQLEVLKFQNDKLNEEKENYEKFIEDFDRSWHARQSKAIICFKARIASFEINNFKQLIKMKYLGTRHGFIL